MNKNRDVTDPKFLADVLKKCTETDMGRSKLAQAMIAPLRARRDYASIARKVFTTEPIMTTCPECNCEFHEEHPDNGCSLGHIHNIMET